tara:strand:- start:2930 stop:3175 length:246 start_codon:yes stop_codon:yes gene_type:complete
MVYRKVSIEDAEAIRWRYGTYIKDIYQTMSIIGKVYGVSGACVQQVMDFKGAYSYDDRDFKFRLEKRKNYGRRNYDKRGAN